MDGPSPDQVETTPVAELNSLTCAFVALARRHGIPLTPQDVEHALPKGEDGLDVGQLVEVAPQLGFDVLLLHKDIGMIDPMALPALVFDHAGQTAIFERVEKETNTYLFRNAATGAENRLGLPAARAAFLPFVLHVAPEGGNAGKTPPFWQPDHWLWSVVRVFLPSYGQVALAALLINLLALASAIFTKIVYDRVIPNLAISTLFALSAGVAIVLVLDFVLRSLRAHVVDEVGRRVDLAVSGRLFDRMLTLKLSHRPASSGVLAAELRDFESVRDVLTSGTLIAVADFAFIGIFIGVMAIIVGPLAFVPLVAVLLVLAITLAVQVPMMRALRATQQDSARRHGLLVESASSLETIKSTGAEAHFRAGWDRAVAAASSSAAQARGWSNLAMNLLGTISQAVGIIILVWGVFLVIEGSVSVGALIAASILAGRILAPLGNIAATLARLQQAWLALASLERFAAHPSERAAQAGLAGRTAQQGPITFKEVGFTYPGGRSPALQNVSFTLSPGERVGVIGRIGSGKTTLGRLMIGLYAPDHGAILLNGVDIRQISVPLLRAHIGYCPSEAELFSANLRENILIGQPEAGEDAITRALAISGLEALVASHPAGLAMPVGERGRTLSSGQRQQVALARTLIRAPRVLVLDEPTAGMDSGTERQILERLKSMPRGEDILLMTTHREAMLELVDRLLVFEAGRLVMDGPRERVLVELKAMAEKNMAERKITGKTMQPQKANPKPPHPDGGG